MCWGFQYLFVSARHLAKGSSKLCMKSALIYLLYSACKKKPWFNENFFFCTNSVPIQLNLTFFPTRKLVIFPMIGGSFGSAGSLFLENAGKINLPAEQQRHLPQTVCHLIGTWNLNKFGMVRVDQTHKLQEIFQSARLHFFQNFQGTMWEQPISYQVIRPGLFFGEFNKDSRYGIGIVMPVKLRKLLMIFVPLPPPWNGLYYVSFTSSYFWGFLVCCKIGLETDIQSNCFVSNKMVVLTMNGWTYLKLDELHVYELLRA